MTFMSKLKVKKDVSEVPMLKLPIWFESHNTPKKDYNITEPSCKIDLICGQAQASLKTSVVTKLMSIWVHRLQNIPHLYLVGKDVFYCQASVVVRSPGFLAWLHNAKKSPRLIFQIPSTTKWESHLKKDSKPNRRE